MAKSLASDELWAIIEPHIPVKKRKKRHKITVCARSSRRSTAGRRPSRREDDIVA